MSVHHPNGTALHVTITYDLRGFGWSPAPNEQVPYSHEADYLASMEPPEMINTAILNFLNSLSPC